MDWSRTQHHRYLTLVAARETAAAAVVVMHLQLEVLRGSDLAPSGYLAVDFLFALSGLSWPMPVELARECRTSGSELAPDLRLRLFVCGRW